MYMGTKSFVIEFETGLTKKDRDLCEKKLRIGRQIYNAALGESIKRAKKVNNDPFYVECKKALADLYKEAEERKAKEAETEKEKGKSKKSNKLPKDLEEKREKIYEQMNLIQEKNGWGGKYSLNDQRTLIKQHFGSGIGTTVVTQTVIRAYRTINNIEKLNKEIELPDGTKRHATFNEKVKAARFVKKNDDFSIESSSNNNGIYFKNGLLYFNRKSFIDVDTRKCDTDAYYREAIHNKIKYCRLLSRTIRGKKRYYVQLVMEGVPPMGKRNYATGTAVELVDVKISHYDIQTDKGVEEVELAPNCKKNEDKLAHINRKMDSSRRANNPKKYNPDGTFNSSAKKIPWKNSKRYERLKAQYQDISRKNRCTRKICLEKQANDILTQGTNITIKHLSYKTMQKRKKKTEINEKTGRPKSKSMAGKAIANRAPSYFVSAIVRKAGYVGGEVNDISTE